jgi:hypothetical protein
MSWLTGWNYRKPITVSSGSALTNYQVLITVDTVTLVTASKLLSSCNDIRFTPSDGSTLINYWIESGPNTSSTKIWVKIPSISSGSNTIYMYYGNAVATSTSNGVNTFDLFNAGNTLTGWNYNGASIVSNQIVIANGASNNYIASQTAITRPSILEFSGVVSAGKAANLAFVTTNNNSVGTTMGFHYSSNNSKYTLGTGFVSYAVRDANLHHWKISWGDSAAKMFEDGNEKTVSGFPSQTSFYIHFGSNPTDPAGNAQVNVYNIFVRKYASPEPTYTTGTEETLTCNAPSANLIVLEMVSNQLLRQYPSYIDLNAISKLIYSLGDNKI